MAKAGKPGALASSGRDASAATDQREAAALGMGAAAMRTIKVVTREAAAISERRRDAFRSRTFGAPQGSISTAPSAAQRAASAPALSTSVPSFARTSTRRAGSSPS